MLSLFPDLYNYSNIVPIFFRLFLGLYFIVTAFQSYRNFKSQTSESKRIYYSIISLVSGLLLLLGLYTQLTSLILALFVFYSLLSVKNVWPTEKKPSVDFIVLLIITLLSLVLTGPGPFSIDLPL